MKQLMIVFILCSQLCFADTGQVVPIYKNQPAPFDGFVIDYDKANQIRKDEIDLSASTRTNELLRQDSTIFIDRLNNYRDANDYLAKRLTEERGSSFFSKTAFFIFGAVVTGAISYGLVKTVR